MRKGRHERIFNVIWYNVISGAVRLSKVRHLEYDDVEIGVHVRYSFGYPGVKEPAIIAPFWRETKNACFTFSTRSQKKVEKERKNMSGQKVKYVNKQFNSPINLYSPQAIQETLERQTQVLANGAVGLGYKESTSDVDLEGSVSYKCLIRVEMNHPREQEIAAAAAAVFVVVFVVVVVVFDVVIGESPPIDFNQLAKPANLQNSAVLRMLEEEEARQRGGQPNLKRVAWPPPPEDQDLDFVEQGPVQAKTRGIGEIPSYQSSPSSGPSPQPPSTVARSSTQSALPSSPSPSISPSGTLLRQPSHFQQPFAPKGWAPVTPPATSPILQQHPLQAWSNQPQQQQQAQTTWKQHPQEHNERTRQQNQPYQSYGPASYEAPPSTIVLRPEPPISQAPAPVYQAQPAATKAPISGNMRGDLKWPPPSVKAQTEAENRARMDLAKGPAFRPRRVNKDYSGFFAQHALNNTYPGYRAPPGTQYFTPSYQH
ncbi:alpha-protein kinase 1-like isoform X1 [Vespula maculifrons]|uniref:Alpha-protein kinase 1-like isoform X1 n=1 Tax=Vespula maculifrons TaxID=7453 RepID=A0ABD2CN79_VESMC